MIEITATLARWSQLTANLILFGSCIFLAIVGQQKAVFETSWVSRLEKGFPWLAGVVLLGLIAILAMTTGEATGRVVNTWSPVAWFEIVQQTRVGHLWAARALLAVVLFSVILYVQRLSRVRWHYILWAVAASFPLIAGSLMSHSGAEEISFSSIAPYALHILLAGIWFGALPAFLLIIYDSRRASDKTSSQLNAASLKQFSVIALPVMLLIMATGLMLADRMVKTYYHALVASSYGWLLNFKLAILALILFIAHRARYRWLPLFSQFENTEQVKTGAEHLRKWVGFEFILALLLVLLAIMLANTLPAKHVLIENWPYPFRFSINATWEEPNVQELVWTGAALLLIALLTIWLGRKKNWTWKKRILVPGALMVIALAIALPPLAIEAYPETYQKTPVPFDAISISNGSLLYAEHCASCHGPQGKGNGELADTLSTEPTDLLTKPHTARHTVGNFFHWLSHGIPGTDMPGFAAVLSEENRWDIVNYLHALSRGFDARLLGTMIMPESPDFGAPVFSYFAHDGSGGSLKDFRLQKNILLVLFSWPQSQQRLSQLKEAYENFSLTHNTEIMAVPMRAPNEQELRDIKSSITFPVVTEGWQEISKSYLLYRRNRTVPDLLGKGMTPGHMEFLIDRFGYLRARWVAQFDGFGWLNVGVLTQQLRQLNQEGQIMPPPGDHVH
ncbi:CopD family protein [Nitrosomonas communis]|uniref:Putative copper resistance protein D n=1 Tax=Nitrosomonas communis TaxID=44574 RepID=A0A1I4K6S6_9PROT|nr:CopD family protein [Nitrosomonas communis]SFL74297.1 putative copper resistance protein D [Nitrosomonas communis]